MRTVRSVPDLRQGVDAWHADRETVAVVPTMGALHGGHLSLVALARQRADRVVTTLFINPRQFGPAEDLARYPRNEAADADLLREAGVDLLYAPGPDAMYPDGFTTTISLGGPAEGLETEHRPGFFEGVATVVAKLLLQAGADDAIFGEKDYQQLLVVRRLVADLNIRTTIVGAPTLREADGLAMSSRNAYLSDAERQRAATLHGVLQETARALVSGARAADAVAAGLARLEEVFDTVDYLALRDAATLAPLDTLDRMPSGSGRLLAAVHLGTTRLIDNVAVDT